MTQGMNALALAHIGHLDGSSGIIAIGSASQADLLSDVSRVKSREADRDLDLEKADVGDIGHVPAKQCERARDEGHAEHPAREPELTALGDLVLFSALDLARSQAIDVLWRRGRRSVDDGVHLPHPGMVKIFQQSLQNQFW